MHLSFMFILFLYLIFTLIFNNLRDSQQMYLDFFIFGVQMSIFVINLTFKINDIFFLHKYFMGIKLIHFISFFILI